MFLAGANVLVEAKVLAAWPSLGNGRSGQERAGMGLYSDALCYPPGWCCSCRSASRSTRIWFD
jgi:hypothetical protein